MLDRQKPLSTFNLPFRVGQDCPKGGFEAVLNERNLPSLITLNCHEQIPTSPSCRIGIYF